MGYVGPSLCSWLVPGEIFFFFFTFAQPPTPIIFLMVHPSDIWPVIKHCEINNGQRVDMNIVFAS